MRITEEEAIQLGFVKDKDGQWHKGKPQNQSLEKSVPSISPREMPKSKSNIRKHNERKVKDKEELQTTNVEGVKFKIVVSSYRHRDIDPDNLCPKHYIDILVRRKVLPDDSSKYIESVEKKVFVIPRTDSERTEIEIFKLE